jgi:hypothetical protein
MYGAGGPTSGHTHRLAGAGGCGRTIDGRVRRQGEIDMKQFKSTARRVAGAFVAGALVVAGGISSAGTAQARTTASCVLTAPYRVVIGQPYKQINLYASGVCSLNGGWSSWDLYHPSQGLQEIAYFGGSNRDYWDLYSDNKIGRQTWRPAGAYDGGSTSLSQNTVYSDVRLATAAWITSKRTQTVVTLTGTSLLYSPTSNSYFKRSAGGVFQFRERGTTTWKNLKAVTTNSAGTATMSYKYSKTRDYRFALYTTPISWDQVSAPTTR